MLMRIFGLAMFIWARIQRVLPGMQAAFVELGTGKAAYLYVGDVVGAQPEP